MESIDAPDRAAGVDTLRVLGETAVSPLAQFRRRRHDHSRTNGFLPKPLGRSR